MTGLEDTNEIKPTNHTPAIALGVAALLLLVVAGMSFNDYLRNKIEKEFAEKEEARIAKYGTPQQAYPQQQASSNQQQQAPKYPRDQRGNQYPQQTSATQQQAQTKPPVQQADPSRFPAQTNLPAPQDTETQRLADNLAKVKEQARATEKRYNDLSRKEGTTVPPTQPAPSGNNTQGDLSPSMRSALEAPPGGNPEIMASLSRLKKQVMSSPAIGKVLSYDKDWGIITFDAGTAQGVKKDLRFAVRRGSDILGWVKVDEVHADQAIAHMVTGNAKSDTSLKPQIGDDLIQFEL